jgi:hypothetical protein
MDYQWCDSVTCVLHVIFGPAGASWAQVIATGVAIMASGALAGRQARLAMASQEKDHQAAIDRIERQVQAQNKMERMREVEGARKLCIFVVHLIDDASNYMTLAGKGLDAEAGSEKLSRWPAVWEKFVSRALIDIVRSIDSLPYDKFPSVSLLGDARLFARQTESLVWLVNDHLDSYNPDVSPGRIRGVLQSYCDSVQEFRNEFGGWLNESPAATAQGE